MTIDIDRRIVCCRGHQSRLWPCLETNLDFLPLRRPPASSDSPSTAWSSRSLWTRNVSVFLPFFLREALIRHANTCNTRSRPAGLAPLLVPGPLYGKASIRARQTDHVCWCEAFEIFMMAERSLPCLCTCGASLVFGLRKRSFADQ